MILLDDIRLCASNSVVFNVYVHVKVINTSNIGSRFLYALTVLCYYIVCIKLNYDSNVLVVAETNAIKREKSI